MKLRINNYKKRLIERIINDKLKGVGAVVINGPKYCGKTTTALTIANSEIKIDENGMLATNIHLSEINPSLLLNGNTPRLIDEWQLAPLLWDEIRNEIDSRSFVGQFILTGSSTPIESDKITHSGAGRFSFVNMRTMSLYESLESSGEVSLETLFNNPTVIKGVNKLSLKDISYIMCRGGWPHSLDLDKNVAISIVNDYVDAIVKSDINRADGIKKNPERVMRLMRSLARNQGTQVSDLTICKDIATNDVSSLSVETVNSYINALKKIFIIEDLRAWNPNLRSKISIRTSDTRYYVDPSIATSLLGIRPNDLINNLNTMGFLFETMAIRDLRIYAETLSGEVYHYRDKTDLECDAVIHLRNGKYGLIEIKLGGDTLIEQACKNLIRLKNKIDTNKMHEPSFLMVLVATGPYAYKRKDGIYVVPIGTLKN